MARHRDTKYTLSFRAIIKSGRVKPLALPADAPPRSLKSIIISVAWPAFLLGHDPTLRIICVSYSIELAKKFSNDLRTIIESTWYQSLFPETRIGPHKNSETEIEFTKLGFRLATSIGETLTGRGGNIVIIDDPLKPEDALSEVQRTRVNDWFNNTLLSRLDDKQTGVIVLCMQRVHMDDLTGFLLARPNEWRHLSLSAIATCDEIIPTWDGREYHRRQGDALSPEREPLDILETLKRQIGSDAFSAQYQQTPVPPGGAMIKRHWIQRYTEYPPVADRLIVLQSWDTASKGGPDNDWSVCTTFIRTRDMKSYLIDLWRGRVDYPALRDRAEELAKRWKPNRILIEDTGTGTGLIQELKPRLPSVIGVTPDRDKISRMSVASSRFEAGQVLLPVRASWLADLEAELFAFPGGRHDDQCDSISQALMDEGTCWWAGIDLQRIIDESRRTATRGPYASLRKTW